MFAPLVGCRGKFVYYTWIHFGLPPSLPPSLPPFLSLSLSLPLSLTHTAPGPECEFYTGDICYGQGPVGLDHVYINTSIATQTEYEERMNEFYNTIANFDSKCRDAFMEYMCISTFSSCDLSHPQPRPHQVKALPSEM